MKTPTPWFLILDPDTDEPQKFEGSFALHHESEQICDGLSLEDATHIVKCVNNHDDLVFALKSLVKAVKLKNLRIEKDFDLLLAHAVAVKALHNLKES